MFFNILRFWDVQTYISFAGKHISVGLIHLSDYDELINFEHHELFPFLMDSFLQIRIYT